MVLFVLIALVAACAAVPESGIVLPDGVVRGNVSFPDLRPLPAGAEITVEVIDPTISGYPANVFASSQLQVGGLRSPVPFQIAFDPARVRPGVEYLIGARVASGDELLYVSQSGQNLFADGIDLAAVDIATTEMPAQAAVPGQLNGVLTWLTRDVLPENAAIAVQLIDRTTQPYQRVAETSFRSEGAQTPISFLLNYDPSAIDPLRTYAIEARISVDGRLAWLTRQPVAALTQDAPGDNLEIALERVASEANAQEGNTIVANLVFPAGDELPIGSTVQVEIIDKSQDAIVASTELRGEGLTSPLAVPITLDFTPSELRQFVLRARILGVDEELYIDESEIPVLTQGAPVTNIAVPLVALRAPVVFATSAATPIAVPTAIALTGDAPAPGLAPSFPGSEDGSEDATEESTEEIAQDEGAFSGVLEGAINFEDAELFDESASLELLLAMVLDGEPVIIAQEALDDFGDDAVAFALAYEPSLIEPEADYLLTVQALNEAGDVIGVSDEISVLTAEAPTAELSLLLERVAVESAEADANVTPEATQTPDVTETSEGTETPESTETPEGAEATDSGSTATLTGTIGYVQRVALPAGAVVSVQLLDLSSSPFRIVSEDRILTAGEQPPFDFALPLDALDSSDIGVYAVAATITSEGETLWSAPELTPLTTSGEPVTQVDLLVSPGVNGGSAMPNDDAPARGVGDIPTAATAAETPAVAETPALAETPAPAATSTIDVSTGDVVAVVVALGDQSDPGPGTQLRAELRDVTSSTVVAETTVEATRAGESVGIALRYNPADILPTNEYRVFVTVLRDGAPVGFTGRGTAVLTNEAPSAVTIEIP